MSLLCLETEVLSYSPPHWAVCASGMAQTQQQQRLLAPREYCPGNASEPNSRGNGSRNVFITAAATIPGTKTEADITSGGGRLFHEPGWVAGCSQLSQSSSRSLLTHSNEPTGILHCEGLPSVRQAPKAILGHGSLGGRNFGRTYWLRGSRLYKKHNGGEMHTSMNFPLCLSSWGTIQSGHLGEWKTVQPVDAATANVSLFKCLQCRDAPKARQETCTDKEKSNVLGWGVISPMLP